MLAKKFYQLSMKLVQTNVLKGILTLFLFYFKIFTSNFNSKSLSESDNNFKVMHVAVKSPTVFELDNSSK